MPQLGEVIIDFNVFSLYDPKMFTIVDNSNWLHIESEPSIIEITFPGSTKPLVFNYLKNSVNQFNSNNLELTCLQGDCGPETYIDLPDGIYTVTVKGSPDYFKKTKYHLKTDRFQMKMDEILIGIGFDYHIDKAADRKKVDEADFLMRVAKAHIRREDIGSAKRFFDLASDVLKKLEDCYK